MVVVKDEPPGSSPTGMELDAMPQVHIWCGVCHQQCPPSEAKTLAVCLRCSSRVHGTCDKRAADALKVGSDRGLLQHKRGFLQAVRMLS